MSESEEYFIGQHSLFYGMECWINKKQHIQKLSVTKIWMLKWIYSNTRLDEIQNEDIHRFIGVTPIAYKMWKNCLR